MEKKKPALLAAIIFVLVIAIILIVNGANGGYICHCVSCLELRIILQLWALR